MEHDKIVSIKYLIRVEGRYDCCHQQAAEWKNGGICGTAQEKEKHCSSKERTMQITSCCASSWPWISLRWKFWRKKMKVQTIRSDFWNNISIAGAVRKLGLFSRWGYSHIYGVLREVLAGLLSSSWFLQLHLLSQVSYSMLLSITKVPVKVDSASPIFYVNRKPMAILREIHSLSAKKMEHVILPKLIYPLFKNHLLA